MEKLLASIQGNREKSMEIKPSTPPDKTISGPGEFATDTVARLSQNETKKQDYDFKSTMASADKKPTVYNDINLNQEEVVKELQATNDQLRQLIDLQRDALARQSPLNASYRGRFGVLAEGMA
jgi:hypothetical protein